MTGNQGKTVVNKKTTDKGITLTVNDLSYDGAALIVGYNLSKPGGFGSDVTDIDLTPYFQSAKDGTPSGRGNLVSTSDSYLSKKDNGDYQERVFDRKAKGHFSLAHVDFLWSLFRAFLFVILGAWTAPLLFFSEIQITITPGLYPSVLSL